MPESHVGKGGCLGNQLDINLDLIDEYYEEYGDEYHFVGMPTDSGSGNWFQNDNVLVVNGNLSDTEEVKAFLQCILRDEIQYPTEGMQLHDSILRVFTDDVETYMRDDGPVYFWKGIRFDVKEDGTTTLDEYRELLESFEPEPEIWKEINKVEEIASEELEAYFYGGRSAEDTARIIDNRVQTYLDETFVK